MLILLVHRSKKTILTILLRLGSSFKCLSEMLIMIINYFVPQVILKTVSVFPYMFLKLNQTRPIIY